jgi:hypothetical protein
MIVLAFVLAFIGLAIVGLGVCVMLAPDDGETILETRNALGGWTSRRMRSDPRRLAAPALIGQ